MKFHVEHPRFQAKPLTVESSLLSGGAKLVVGGRELSAKESPHEITDDAGEPVSVEIEAGSFDPIPKLTIDGRPHELAPPMEWYQWLWVGIPFILVFAGGCIGGGIGGLAVAANVLVFRTADTALKRWGLTFAITGLAFIVAITISTMAHLALQ